MEQVGSKISLLPRLLRAIPSGLHSDTLAEQKFSLAQLARMLNSFPIRTVATSGIHHGISSQLVERANGIGEVSGSIPLGSIYSSLVE